MLCTSLPSFKFLLVNVFRIKLSLQSSVGQMQSGDNQQLIPQSCSETAFNFTAVGDPVTALDTQQSAVAPYLGGNAQSVSCSRGVRCCRACFDLMRSAKTEQEAARTIETSPLTC